MSRSAKAWLAAGWVGFVLLPWHVLVSGSLEWLADLPTRGPPSAAAMALSGQARWLAPIALPLLLATIPLFGARRDRDGRALVAAGVMGLALVVVQGFSIGLDGWRFAFLGASFGAPGPSQPGMGFGAALTAAAFLMLLCHGLAARGWCRGDAFVVGAIGGVLALAIVFVFFPVATILTSAVSDDSGALALDVFAVKFFDP
jgi:iron(III) transport system permease protein